MIVAVANNNKKLQRSKETMLGAPRDVNSFDRDGWTPLMIASHRQPLRAVQELLDAGADVDKGDRDGFAPLMCAAGAGRTEIVVLLLQRGARVDLTDTYGHTALSWAVTKGDFDTTARALISAGADVDKADLGGFTPLMRSALMDHPRCFALLLEHNADVHPVNASWGKTALQMALDRGSARLKELARSAAR